MTTVALAGRRTDPADAQAARFPMENSDLVRDRLARYLTDHTVEHLVCSAACGADLLALEAAGALGSVARTIVLPFDVATFRETSVVDRPGDWGPIYDAIIVAVKAEDGLRLLGLEAGSEAAYATANDRILAEAAEAPSPHRVCIVWEGRARGVVDFTMGLALGGRSRGWTIDEISTLG